MGIYILIVGTLMLIGVVVTEIGLYRLYRYGLGGKPSYPASAETSENKVENTSN
jgi:hypothetical protein